MSAHDSLLQTPQPSACSTGEKEQLEHRHSIPVQAKQVKRNLMEMDISTESLGILSLDDMKPTKESATNIHNTASSFTMESRRRELETTRALLEKYSNWKNHSLLSESTVNESDLKEATNVMTPVSAKGSTINESDLLSNSNQSSSRNASSTSSIQQDNSNTESFSAYIQNMKKQIESANSTASLSDIIGNMTRQSLEFDSGMFQPAEDMKELFEEDQKAWREKYASIPNATRLSFSDSDLSAQFNEKISMGEFFRQKSDNCSLFQTSSPSKRDPIALVNSTAVEDDDGEMLSANDSILSAIDQSIASVLGVSAIQKIITGAQDTPNKMLEQLINAPLSNNLNNFNRKQPQSQSLQQNYLPNESKKSTTGKDTRKMHPRSTSALLKDDYYNSRSSLGSPCRSSTSSSSTASMSKFSKYASSADLSTPTKDSMPSSTKIYSTRSLSSINSSDNKENVLSTRLAEEKNKSLTSCRSTSSMESLPDGMAKLASTKEELVWGCVKEGRSVEQDVTIRNKINRKVKYQINTSNTTFQLKHTDVQGEQGVIVLHPLETRKIVVACAPNSIGPHTGNLFFTPIIRREEQVAHRQHIGMYAYGGHVNIKVKNHLRDPAGNLWISFGCVDGRQELCTDFVISNTGTIDGFVSLVVASKTHCAYDDVSVIPSKVIVKRGTEVNIRARFRPSKNDLHLINAAFGDKSKESCEIAVIKMLSGSDINRQRINKIYKKSPQEHQLSMLGHAQQLNAPYLNSQRGEEIRCFNESSKALKPMMQALDTMEISVLIKRDMDATLLPEIDDSMTLFQTIVYGNEESSLVDQHAYNSYLKAFTVEPWKVILTPPGKCNDYFFLNSNYDRPVGFKIAVSPGGPLSVNPSCGEVKPRELCAVKVECDYSVKMVRQDFEVIFEIEDEILKTIVSVLNI